MSNSPNSQALRSVCPFDCPDACSLKVHLDGDRIVKVEGNEEHPVTRGAICNKVRHLPERVHHPDRLLYPMRRTGPKGDFSFERITWDEAYAEMAQRLRAVVRDYGAEAVLPYSFYGNMGVLNAEGMDRRFFHKLGASKLERTICNAAGAEGYRHTMGINAGVDPEDTVHAKLIVVWGCNLVSTNMHQVLLANEARKRGATIVHIDAHRNKTSRWADWFVPVRPGTDAALALGIMHVLIDEGLTDDAFLAEHTIGFAALAERAKAYPPETVSGITGVPAETVVRLARLYGSTSPSFIRIGNGLQHHDNGGMAVRAIACLPALTGQWGRKGGGAIKGNGAYAAFNAAKVQRPDAHPNPSARSISMNQLGDALLSADPPVKALFVYNSNPALVAPDQNKVREGLGRRDLFTVVHDLFLTDTCRYADLVLPATSHFENLDLYKSYWHLYVQLHEPLLPPMGECKSNFTLFKELAAHMGFEDDMFQASEEDMIREALDSGSPYLEGVTFEALRERGWMKLNVAGRTPFPDAVPTPSGKIELYSETLRGLGLPPVPDYEPIREPDENGAFPFLFVPGPNHNYVNSTFGNVASLKAAEREPTLDMHEDDAAALGIVDGDVVRVWNRRGECRLRAKTGANVLRGVVVSQGLWWDDDGTGGTTVNALTSQRLSDMGRGATFFSTRVAVEKR